VEGNGNPGQVFRFWLLVSSKTLSSSGSQETSNQKLETGFRM